MDAPSDIIVSQPRKTPKYKPAKIDWSTAQKEKHRECYERNWSIFHNATLLSIPTTTPTRTNFVRNNRCTVGWWECRPINGVMGRGVLQ